MFRSLTVLAMCLIVPLLATGRPRLPDPPAGLPVGKWQIEFANGVVETCEVAQDGTANETEPLRDIARQGDGQGRLGRDCFRRRSR